MKPLHEQVVAIRGGGDIATGAIQKFFHAGIRVVILETAQPTAIRRRVALSEAVYEGTQTVEDMCARRISDVRDCQAVWAKGEIPVLIDPGAESIRRLKPDGVVDAILAKRNLGTRPDMAPVVVGLGPGFCVPADVHAVVETMRGHNLGRVIVSGATAPNTGIPGEVGGKSAERVLRAPTEGMLVHHAQIGQEVRRGAAVFSVNQQPVTAPFTGLLRGLLREGLAVSKGMKIADVDPRLDSNWHSISDKARCVGGGALDAYLYLQQKGRAL